MQIPRPSSAVVTVRACIWMDKAVEVLAGASGAMKLHVRYPIGPHNVLNDDTQVVLSTYFLLWLCLRFSIRKLNRSDKATFRFFVRTSLWKRLSNRRDHRPNTGWLVSQLKSFVPFVWEDSLIDKAAAESVFSLSSSSNNSLGRITVLVVFFHTDKPIST